MATEEQRAAAGPIPVEAVRFLEEKDLLPGFSYLDVWAEEHLRAFTAAKVMREDVLEAMHEEVERAIREGVTFQEFTATLRERLTRMGWWGEQGVIDPDTGRMVTIDVPSRLHRIYDTNMRTARAAGQWERIQRTKETHPYLLYQLGPSHRHRPEHVQWHGLMLPADDPFWEEHLPPNGWGCFLPGTRITGNLVGASKAWYSGEAVEIELQSGARLSVTPNHPIATARGWLPAGAIEVGDDCLSHGGEVELIRRAGAPDVAAGAVGDQEVPAGVEDVFDALAAHGYATAKVSPLDFHGEASRFVGKVHVVGTYAELVRHRPASPLDLLGKSAFPRTNRGLVREHAARHGFPLPPGVFSPSGSGPRGAADALGLGAIGFLPTLKRSFGSISDDDVMSIQKPGEGAPAHAAFLSELLHRGSGAVAFDQVVRVFRYPYSGHVFDFESDSGWILANGAVASNCKCWVRQVSRREAARLERDGVMAPEREPILDASGRPTGHLEKRRVPVQTERPRVERVMFTNKRTGVTEAVPKGIDPGFHRPPSSLKEFGGRAPK